MFTEHTTEYSNQNATIPFTSKYYVTIKVFKKITFTITKYCNMKQATISTIKTEAAEIN